MSRYECALHTDESAWRLLRDDWHRLLASMPDGTPWQSVAFLELWWRQFGRKRRLRVYVVSRDGHPVLIFPLQLSRRSWYGVPMQWLEPIGMLDHINRPAFALGPLDPDAWRSGLEAIWRNAAEWHVLRIDEIAADDPSLQLLQEFASSHGLSYQPEPFDPSPIIDLRQSWQAYLQTRSSKFRQNLRSAVRKLEAAGHLTLEVAVTAAEIDVAYSTLLEIHTRSWKHWPRYGLSQSGELQQFYRELLQTLAPQGCARVLTLKLDGRPMAATFALQEATTYYSVEIAHDPEFERFSPGTVLESMELKGLMDEGRFWRYDAMTGTYGNKLRWAERLSPTLIACAFRPIARNRLFESVEYRLRPFVTRQFDRAGLLVPVRKLIERFDALHSRYLDSD